MAAKKKAKKKAKKALTPEQRLNQLKKKQSEIESNIARVTKKHDDRQTKYDERLKAMNFNLATVKARIAHLEAPAPAPATEETPPAAV